MCFNGFNQKGLIEKNLVNFPVYSFQDEPRYELSQFDGSITDSGSSSGQVGANTRKGVSTKKRCLKFSFVFGRFRCTKYRNWTKFVNESSCFIFDMPRK